MGLYTIDASPFKKQHLTFLAISFILMVLSYVAANAMTPTITNAGVNEKIKLVFLILTFGVSFILVRQHKEKLKTIHSLPDFDEQVTLYKKIYTQRLIANVAIGIAACIFYVLTVRRIFILFAIFDLVVLLVLLPNKNVFRRELNNQEIEFK
jgi:peptidoglycan/LPS O-acetylase OafA/YrhL